MTVAEELQQQRQRQQQQAEERHNLVVAICELWLDLFGICFLLSLAAPLICLGGFLGGFLGGPALILYALYFDQQYKTMYRDYRRKGHPVDGYVQQVVVSTNTDNGDLYHATIQYYYHAREQDDTGSYYAFEHTSRIPELPARVGQKVSVLVLPDHPQSGRLATAIPKEPSRREIYFLRALWLAIGVGVSFLMNFVITAGCMNVNFIFPVPNILYPVFAVTLVIDAIVLQLQLVSETSKRARRILTPTPINVRPELMRSVENNQYNNTEEETEMTDIAHSTGAGLILTPSHINIHPELIVRSVENNKYNNTNEETEMTDTTHWINTESEFGV